MRVVSWRPIVGCSFASAGCANCAALPEADANTVRINGAGRVWTGETRLIEAALWEPLDLAEPSTVHVCPHGDLFHEATPEAWISQVFAMMEACPQHVFMLLTKRAGRQRDVLRSRYHGMVAPPHICVGVSAERQPELDRRGEALASTPAAVRYLTLYPLLGPVDLKAVLPAVRWVHAGEEPQRPADPAWFEAAARQCAAVGVPFSRAELLKAA